MEILKLYHIPDEIIKIIFEYVKIAELNDKIDEIYNELQNTKYCSLTRKDIKKIILNFKNKDIILLEFNYCWSIHCEYDDRYERCVFFNYSDFICYGYIHSKRLKRVKRTYLYLMNQIAILYKENIKYVNYDNLIIDQLQYYLSFIVIDK